MTLNSSWSKLWCMQFILYYWYCWQSPSTKYNLHHQDQSSWYHTTAVLASKKDLSWSRPGTTMHFYGIHIHKIMTCNNHIDLNKTCNSVDYNSLSWWLCVIHLFVIIRVERLHEPRIHQGSKTSMRYRNHFHKIHSCFSFRYLEIT